MTLCTATAWALCDRLGAELLSCAFVLQSWARLRMSPPHSLPWSWMGWRSTPTTVSRCWPSPVQGMASEVSRSSPAPKRMVRPSVCTGGGQILHALGHTRLMPGLEPLLGRQVGGLALGLCPSVSSRPHSFQPSLPSHTAKHESGPPPQQAPLLILSSVKVSLLFPLSPPDPTSPSLTLSPHPPPFLPLSPSSLSLLLLRVPLSSSFFFPF